MNQPIVSVPLSVSDEKRREIFCTTGGDQVAIKGTLDEQSPVPLGRLDFINRFALPQVGDAHGVQKILSALFFAGEIQERIDAESENHLGTGQISKNLLDQIGRNLLVAVLIQHKD